MYVVMAVVCISLCFTALRHTGGAAQQGWVGVAVGYWVLLAAARALVAGAAAHQEAARAANAATRLVKQ